jgi:glycosyltransferase involved in cell wall biosynthesis
MFCGGQGIYAARLARELRALGHEVHVIAGPPLPELEAGTPLHVIPNENFFGRPLRAALPRDNPLRALQPGHLWELGVTRLGVFPEMTSFGLRLALRWRALQRAHRFDVVLDNQSLGWGLLALQASGVPVVSVIHHPLHIDREADFEIDPAFRRRWRRTLYFPLVMQQFVAPRLAGIVTVSHASRREIERYFGIPARRVSVVHNGTDAEVFRPLQRPPEVDLIFVGRTEDRKKGVLYLLDALARTPSHLRLKIVDGRILPDGLVPRRIRALGLEERVVLVRRMLNTAQLAEQYASARLAVVPSYFEGFGFPASEAMAAGLPVIASDRGALPEVVGTSGECGRLVPFRDVDALAAAITDLASLPRDTVAKMGEAARRRVLREFDWRRCAALTAEALAQFARAHRRSRSA